MWVKKRNDKNEQTHEFTISDSHLFTIQNVALQPERCSCHPLINRKSAKRTSLEVSSSIRVSHSKVRDVSICRGHLLEQLNGILTNEHHSCVVKESRYAMALET